MPTRGIAWLSGKGIAALDHEVRDDPVKAGAVVKLAVGELLEIRDGARDLGVEEVGDDGAFAGFDRRGFGHGKSSRCGVNGAEIYTRSAHTRLERGTPTLQCLGRRAATRALQA